MLISVHSSDTCYYSCYISSYLKGSYGTNIGIVILAIGVLIAIDEILIPRAIESVLRRRPEISCCYANMASLYVHLI